ncbi:hypothetical protein PF010_g25270 [Phytophthora fragariae]|uniref:Uncharacterized protein n=1 Tax=Phytophthora fragariae TaxID=53985 RepID=A0A6A3TVW5_9STRA|nr:hypothetical protein PF003_g27635 [Phytophthora fragariae]KAE8936532.1 hypothetical protein PF009_g13545 [Phytophthora fragariae]KAE9072966.1 hypothetical protein PF010_g25270 [Phytophthora fragariae]KAE9077927.1 hypothetical protein PF007_g24063 [Phytophthora fragariae]KAE9143382.1 hypothetical protein PF006_g11582 [Phytophthora fragariae]
MASTLASHAATYSTLAVDKAIIDCRREIHAMSPPVSEKTNPVVRFRYSGSFAQSLSLYPSNTTSSTSSCFLA